MTRLLALSIAITLSPAAFAQTYLVATGDCGAVTLHATGGSAELVKDAYLFLPKERVALKPAAGARSLDFNADLGSSEGVVMASVEFTPVIAGNETRTEHAKALIFC